MLGSGSGRGCWGQLGGRGIAQAAGPTGLAGAGTLHQAGAGEVGPWLLISRGSLRAFSNPGPR